MNVRTALRLGFLLATIGSASIALAAPPATTKGAEPPLPKVPLLPSTGLKLPAPAPVTWTVSNAWEGGMRDAQDVAASSSLGGVTALAGFRFRFDNGDHKLRRIGVTPKERLASFAFADSNGDDPFSAAASWAVLSRGKSGVVSATGGGQFEIPLPGGKVAGHKLVLSGFEFRRKDGSDANVRSIGVWLDGNRAVARVMLMDDQGPDFRGFERTIGATLLGGLPLGELKMTTDTLVAALGKVNRGEANGKYRPYAVSVQYAWIPDSAVASTDVFTGTGRAPASGKVFPTNSVLSGFEFFFTSSDHHLLDIGVMGPMMRAPSIAVLQPPAGEVVEYQDNNRDDPMRWAVELAALKPSGT